MYKASNLDSIKILTKELEEVKLEKDGLDGKLAGLLKASKNLDHLIESQRSDQVKEGVGYNAVPPPAADLYLSPKKDLSWTGLPEFVDDTVTDYSRPSPTVVSTSPEGQNKDSSTSEDVASPNPPKPFVKAVPRNILMTKDIDSGCSRHMTGNISYLSDFEAFDEGYVSFGQGGCKITGNGTIKTGKLEFENVYFVKDLKMYGVGKRL
uniref:Ribonuclease H-like domain-containing protein n=1 Tax=Tanacetum cinerariifolium TaxID=118510 RepID=A0A6L2N0D8_TANCI|nr:ribonuclease H-like domain-containing protein [Tanacetum cinerariifolium]